MKFANLLTLLAATSAFALNFKRDDQITQALAAAQGEQGDGTAELMEVMQCLSTISNMMEKCYGTPVKTMEDFQKVSEQKVDCKLINSNECQTVLKETSSGSCGGTLSSITPYMNIYCITDEKGDLCPLSKLMQEVTDKVKQDPNYNQEGNLLTDKDLEETCKSKKCTEESVNAFKEMKKTGIASTEEDTKEMDSYIAKLGEDKCKNAAVTVNGNNSSGNNSSGDSSGATQIKVGSALLATLALAFYFF